MSFRRSIEIQRIIKSVMPRNNKVTKRGKKINTILDGKHKETDKPLDHGAYSGKAFKNASDPDGDSLYVHPKHGSAQNPAVRG